MDIRMHRQPTVNVHQFAMVPKADIPRSSFLKQSTHKTTFDENYLVPVYVDEVLPGDTFSLSMTGFARLTTPIFPVMDNMYLDTFFFFCPCRLVWDNWIRFMGEQDNPADSISYTVPTISVAGAGVATGSLQDYMGLPNQGQVTGGNWSYNVLPFRAYNLIWNQWFRDENLQNSVLVSKADAGGTTSDFVLQKRGKRHDYFTSCLPWTQKGGVAQTIPLGTQATIKSTGTAFQIYDGGSALRTLSTVNAAQTFQLTANASASGNATFGVATQPVTSMYVDLSTATAATVNQLRQSFQIQRLLERDARGGSRYTEIIRAHFGVVSPDARLQRTEYLGGGTTPVNISPIPQTTATGLTGGTTPLGNLAAYGTMLAHNHGFTQSFTEHGYIIGLANIRADITYQQGLRKLWSRSTRYDFYFPAFAMLGEQSVLNKEIYIDGSANDALTFGYQERWAEYRYMPSMITGQFRSTYATPLDAWHLAEKFTALPTLSSTFIPANAPVARVSASAVSGSHFIFDGFFNVKCTRPMPLYSVPGMIDHF